jgi:hypothetical protein
MTVQQQHIRPDILRQLIWDYDMNGEDFIAILHGDKQYGWFTKAWAISRILERLNYYDAMTLISPAELAAVWEELKPKLFNQTIRNGYEFILRRHTLPTSE